MRVDLILTDIVTEHERKYCEYICVVSNVDNDSHMAELNKAPNTCLAVQLLPVIFLLLVK